MRPQTRFSCRFFAFAAFFGLFAGVWGRQFGVFAAVEAPLSSAPCNAQSDELWSAAEARRADGRWDEALDFYRRHHARYALAQNCAVGSAAFETMALTQSACLENLGRYDQAVELLWSAARSLPSHLPPRALRHLVDLYLATGQITALQGTGAGLGSLEWRFERVRHYRKAARERRWNVLLATLHYSPDAPDAPYQTDKEHEIATWNRREAIVALSLIGEEAVALLERALAKRHNPYYRAAWLACVPQHERQSWLEGLHDFQEALSTYDAAINEEPFFIAPLVFPQPPRSLRLPAHLP